MNFAQQSLDASGELRAVEATFPLHVQLAAYLRERVQGVEFHPAVLAYEAEAEAVGQRRTRSLYLVEPGSGPSSSTRDVGQGTKIVAVFDNGAVMCSCRDSHAMGGMCPHLCAVFTAGFMTYNPVSHTDCPLWYPRVSAAMREGPRGALHLLRHLRVELDIRRAPPVVPLTCVLTTCPARGGGGRSCRSRRDPIQRRHRRRLLMLPRRCRSGGCPRPRSRRRPWTK